MKGLVACPHGVKPRRGTGRLEMLQAPVDEFLPAAEVSLFLLLRRLCRFDFHGRCFLVGALPLFCFEEALLEGSPI